MPRSRHDRRLAAMGERIVELERSGKARAAALLRAAQERYQGDLDGLRRAFADDRHNFEADAEELWRLAKDDMAAADKDEMLPVAPMGELPVKEMVSLDRALDEVAGEVGRAQAAEGADRAALARIEAQIDEARDRRFVIPGSAPADVGAAGQRYAAAVREAVESWRRYRAPPEAPRPAG
jgi:hypothetical protein